MDAPEIALALFALFNSARLVAYLPQILVVWQDRQGAKAISCTTWALFASSNFSTTTYAIFGLGDWGMALVFGVNTICCVAILTLTGMRRAQFRERIAAALPARAAEISRCASFTISSFPRTPAKTSATLP
jgi:hypothetical protein